MSAFGGALSIYLGVNFMHLLEFLEMALEILIHMRKSMLGF